jgi:acetoacetate decarboxylase
MAAKEPFPDGIDVEEIEVTVDGVTRLVEVPQRYYEWSFMMAHFPAPTRHVRHLLPDDRLTAVELAPGIAVISLAAFEYRTMATLAPYNEFAIMVPVRYEPDWNIPLLPLLWPDHYEVGFWVHHLPVTTEEARDVGIGVWGLPKVVADIEFRDIGWTRQCELSEDGEHAVTLSVSTGETRLAARRFYAYSVLDGELLKALVDTRGHYYDWYLPGGASFALGRHPVADELRELEVQNIAIAGLYAFSAKSRLHPGTVLAEALSSAASGTP